MTGREIKADQPRFWRMLCEVCGSAHLIQGEIKCAKQTFLYCTMCTKIAGCCIRFRTVGL
eukprot:1729651-Rhodomonas_salina.1